MSDAAQVELMKNFPAILTALGVILVAIFTYRNGRKTDVVEAKLETNTQATAAIKASVDGTASANLAQIKGLQHEIQLLRDILKDKDKDAALLAQAVVSGAINTVPRKTRSTDAAPIEVVVTNVPLAVKTENDDSE